MNTTVYYSTDDTRTLSVLHLLSLPQTLWAYYLEYLWFYAPDSWVAKIANAALLLAVLVSLPIVILGLLDIASYGIARTLGVIDDTKASTSDKATIHTAGRDPTDGALTPPAIYIQSPTGGEDSSEALFSDSDRETLSPGDRTGSEPSLFYVGEGDSLKLSGVGVFSPAASQPPSPTISRQNLAVLREGGTEQLRQRTVQRVNNDAR